MTLPEGTEQVCAITMFCAAEMLAEKIGKRPSSCLRAMADLVDQGWVPVAPSPKEGT